MWLRFIWWCLGDYKLSPQTFNQYELNDLIYDYLKKTYGFMFKWVITKIEIMSWNHNLKYTVLRYAHDIDGLLKALSQDYIVFY